ncbi:MAG: hypothetical protein IPM25_20095 [Chloracidobacterium sp.]|nr:hypothetical protein [Chloracidobacterium sp.]
MKLMLDDAYATHGMIDVAVLAIMAANPMWPAEMEGRYKAIAPKTDYHVWDGVSHFFAIHWKSQTSSTSRYGCSSHATVFVTRHWPLLLSARGTI